jgi:hypothetical protein
MEEKNTIPRRIEQDQLCQICFACPKYLGSDTAWCRVRVTTPDTMIGTQRCYKENGNAN